MNMSFEISAFFENFTLFLLENMEFSIFGDLLSIYFRKLCQRVCLKEHTIGIFLKHLILR